MIPTGRLLQIHNDLIAHPNSEPVEWFVDMADLRAMDEAIWVLAWLLGETRFHAEQVMLSFESEATVIRTVSESLRRSLPWEKAR